MKNTQNLNQKAEIQCCFSRTMRLPRYGYMIAERKEVINRGIAYKVLTPALQRKCKEAMRCENTIVITKQVIVCPHCGKESSAYRNHELQIKSQEAINAWEFPQLSMFEEQPDKLTFNEPINITDHYVCPRCSTALSPSKGFVDVSITVNKRGVKISRRLEFKELFAIKWLPDQLCITEFELYETITFHLKKGRTFVALENENGNKLQVYDISNIKANHYFDDPIFELINLYKPINRELKNQFIKFFHTPLPFRTNELKIEQFILMTKFIGYDAAFYNALPYAEDKHLIEQRFDKMAKRLHHAKNVPDIFQKTTLPQVKSIRKVIFSNPALLFYKAELEQVWQLLEDVNRFRSFITSKQIFFKLWDFCKMPRLIDFYTEFKAELGIKGLCKIMIDAYLSKDYVAWYFMLSEYDKQVERRRWYNGNKYRGFYRGGADDMGAHFSIPISEHSSETFERSTLECCIQGYSFRRLKNSAEYLKAGKELNNCLTDWSWFCNYGYDVYGIMKKNKYIAAVEVRKHEIIQAHTYGNGDISENKSLKKAFDIWRNRNMLDDGEKSQVVR